MVDILKIPFRFKDLNSFSKVEVLEGLEEFGSVMGPIEIGNYTIYYLFSDLNDEYSCKTLIDGEYRNLKGIKEYMSIVFNLLGHTVY